MGQEQNFSTSPPKTEVLSVTDPQQLTPEELSELGKEKVETEEVPVETKPETITQEETEEVTPEPTKEELEKEPEITHEPDIDTKRKIHQLFQENAKLKKMFNAAIAKDEFREPPTAQEMFKLPERPTIPKPDKFEDDRTYVQEVAKTIEQQKVYDDIVSDYDSFVAENPDWLELQPTMQKISRLYPELMYGRRAMHKIYNLAVLYQESAARQQARDEELAEAQSTGAKMEREKVKATTAFVKPGGGTAKSKPEIPNFANMEMGEIEKWLKDNREKALKLGLIKED